MRLGVLGVENRRSTACLAQESTFIHKLFLLVRILIRKAEGDTYSGEHADRIERTPSGLGMKLNSPNSLAARFGRFDTLYRGIADGALVMLHKRGPDVLGVEEEWLPALGEGVHKLESVLIYERYERLLSTERGDWDGGRRDARFCEVT